MDEQQLPREGKKPKRRLWKFVGAFFVIVILAYGGLAGVGVYTQRSDERRIQELAEHLKKGAEEAYQARLRDTYGGTTPQETLQMYIDAVEKGDYELASKYFVIEKQEDWLNELITIRDSGKINDFIQPIIIAKTNRGEYSPNQTTYSIHKPILVSFIRYPNGVWKIMEI